MNASARPYEIVSGFPLVGPGDSAPRPLEAGDQLRIVDLDNLFTTLLLPRGTQLRLTGNNVHNPEGEERPWLVGDVVEIVEIKTRSLNGIAH